MTGDTRKYEILTGLTVLALTFGMFIAGEFALRVAQWSKFGQQESVEKSNAYFIDEKTGLRLNKPNRKLGNIRINNLGYRGPDVRLEKPAGTVRLAFLGSSTTYDAYSPEGRNWPDLVAAGMRQQVQGCEVDFINAGKPGYNIEAMGKIFESFVVDTDPDIVIAMTGSISSGLDSIAEQQGIDTDHTAYQSPLNKYSLLLQKLEKNFQIIKLQRAAKSRNGKLKVDYDELVRRYTKKLDALLDVIDGSRRVVGLVTLSSQLSEEMTWEELVAAGNTQLYYVPYVYLPDLLALYEAFNGAIQEVTARHDAIVIDGEREIPASSRYYKDSVHFTPAGSEAMSSRVVSRLISNQHVVSLLEEKGCNVVLAAN